ncbi:MAG: hypothetical protein ABR915_10625 [Thermoguttaceae bacterium]|jgi:tetratricopeptide (TPR) repeat protein
MTGQVGRGRATKLLGLAVGLALAAWTPGPGPRAEAAERAPTAAEIERAVPQLGDPEYTVRERASQTLWEAGKAAEPALEKALQSSDCEVSYRARQILGRFRWGIFPDTPPKTVQWINRFRFGDVEARREVCRQLAAAKDLPLLRRLIELEPDKSARQTLAREFLDPDDVLNRSPAQQVAHLLLDGNMDGAERMLQDATDDALVRDYAALLLARGKADGKIAELRAGLRQQADAVASRRLAYLLRARGDAAAAVEAAKETSDDNLVREFAIEAGQWAEALRRKAGMPPDAWIRAQLAALGRLAAYQRLAGQREAMDQSLSEVVKRCPQEPGGGWFGAALLLINGRITDGIDLMYQQDKASGFQLLCVRGQYREALRRAGPDEAALLGPNWLATLGLASADDRAVEGFRLGCEMVRTLHRLGEKEKARDLLATLVAVAGKDKDERGVLLSNLSACEIDLGLSEAAAEHVARLLARHPDQAHSAFYKMFPGQFEIAEVFWRLLRAEYAGEKEAALLGRLQRLLAAGAPVAGQADELRKLAARLETVLRNEKKDARGAALVALASFCQSRGQDNLAAVYAEKAAAESLPADGLVKVGNIFADQKQWDRAARAYEEASTKDRHSAAALYLLGHARLQSGREAEGRRQMELALLLPLGDTACRYHLIEAIKRLGLHDEVIRQCKLALVTGPFQAWAGSQALEQLGDDADHRGDRLTAADCWERLVLGLLQPNIFLRDHRGYLLLPFRIHASRGRGLLKAGKVAEALDELRQAETAIPGNVEFVLSVVPELEQAGRKPEADALFQRTAALHEDICRDFPRSANHHNDLAWLTASLNRDLDKALAHAKLAVELEPDRAAYLDTLAEVRFRQGDRAEAVRLTKRCIELDPKRDYYGKQLDRFQAK